MNNLDFEKGFRIFLNVFDTGKSYFGNPSIYEVDIANSDDIELRMTGIFKDKPSIEAALIKLVHNYLMIEFFTAELMKNFEIESFRSMLEYKLDPQKNFYLKIRVDTENIRIIEKRGFGLIFYDHKEVYFAASSLKTKLISLMKDYKKDLESKNDNKTADDIQRFVDFASKYFSFESVNDGLLSFINDNMDMYSKFDKEL